MRMEKGRWKGILQEEEKDGKGVDGITRRDERK